MTIEDHKTEVAGLLTHWRGGGPSGDTPPILYLHGVPTASWDWIPYLERIGGIAPDLPGFGTSAKPSDFDYSIDGYVRWLEAFVDAARLDRFALVVHDWGGLGLAFAQRFPERIHRLVLHSSVPLLPGYRWHWIARIWRTPVLGELFQATATKQSYRLISRQSNFTKGPLPEAFVGHVWADFDAGTRRAILKLYRSADPQALAAAGQHLGDIRCPALVLWPMNDPYIDLRFGQAYADALGGEVQLELIERAGHWMWLDRPDVIDKAAAFLAPVTQLPDRRTS